MGVLSRQLSVLGSKLGVGLAEASKFGENVLRGLRLGRLELFGRRLSLAGLETSVFAFEILAMSIRQRVSAVT